MSEDLDPLTTESTATPISHRSILIVMAIVTIAAAIAGFVFGGKAFGFGVLFGGVLSFANYFWLERSTRAIFGQTAVTSTSILAAQRCRRLEGPMAEGTEANTPGAQPGTWVDPYRAYNFKLLIQGVAEGTNLEGGE